MSNKIWDENIVEYTLQEETTLLSSQRCMSIDLCWENLTVSASELKRKIVNNKKIRFREEKVILKDVSGKITSGTFTAIMGPSGCGKTTLLNVLSNRSETRLKVQGKLYVNSSKVDSIDPISNLVAFVQQDDVLLATVTPREVFTFVANLRLNLPAAEKKLIIEATISELGLRKCADTRVGNVFLRGLSGGERKRTSIGAELITNPSIVFLDEPTTGLDSTTGLKIIELLKKLAKNRRTIVTTIHQPSSEIFGTFDNLMLMVKGNIIYSGLAKSAVQYFDSFGFVCPKFTNPADHFMKIMSESGLMLEEMKKGDKNTSMTFVPDNIEAKFMKQVEKLVDNYKKHRALTRENTVSTNNKLDYKKKFHVSWIYQFILLLKRALIDEFRNPLGIIMKIVQNIFIGILIIILWHNLGSDLAGIQDRNGALVMFSTGTTFIALVGSTALFSLERPVFVREIKSSSYTVSAYFMAKIVSELPFFVVYPFIQIGLTYYVLGLNTYDPSKFFICVLFNILSYFAGSGIGVVSITFFPDIVVAYSVLLTTLIPLYACSGFFVVPSQIPYILYPLEYLSPFKYGYQGMMINEYTDLTTLTCHPDPACDYLKVANFKENMLVCGACLIAIGIGCRILAFIGLRMFSLPKAPKLIPIENEEINSDE